MPYWPPSYRSILTWNISMRALFPQRISPLSVTAWMPFPEISSTFSGRSRVIPLSLAASTILVPMGWVEPSSHRAAISRSASMLSLPKGMTLCTWNSPLVMVPVLSITTAFTFFRASMATPPLKRMPFLEPAPMPEKKARGTLSTRAQGQLMTRKVMAV